MQQAGLTGTNKNNVRTAGIPEIAERGKLGFAPSVPGHRPMNRFGKVGAEVIIG